MSDDIPSLLARLPEFRNRQLTISPLAGGLTNRNFKIDAAGESFVLRFFGDNAEMLGINRERERACARIAHANGIGPEVIAYLPGRALVTRFVPGAPLTEADAKKPEVLQRIAGLLRYCHAAMFDEFIGPFSVFETIRTYTASARKHGIAVAHEWNQAFTLLDRIEHESVSHESLCLCHNDLLAANFIDDGSTVKLIDWEYAGRGDRFFDLGNLAVNLQLDEDLERLLLRDYFGEMRADDHRRLKQMRLASDLREASWGYLQAAISKLYTPQYYLDYGRRHLERCLAAAKSVSV